MSDYEQDYTQLYVRGLCMISEGEYEEAVRLFDRVLAVDPAFSDAYIQRGYAKFHLDLIDESLEDLNQAIEFAPDSADAFAFRARSHWVIERHEEAFEDISHALELEPDNVHALHVRAFINMEIERYDEAIDDFDRILDISPDDGHALLMRGWGKLYSGQPQAALHDNDLTLELDPYDGKYHFQRAIIFGALKQYEELLASAQEAIRHHYQGQRPLTYYMGWALLSLGRHEEALSRFEESFESEKSCQILYGIAVALGKSGCESDCHKKLEEAALSAHESGNVLSERFMQQLLADWSPEKAASLPLIEAEAAMQHWLAAQHADNHEEALKQYAETLRHNPLVVGAHANMATIYQEQGRLDDALEALEKAIVFCPDAESYLYHKGLILIDLERYDEAVVLFGRLLEADLFDDACYYQRARAWYFLNETEKAVEDLNVCYEKEPNNEAVLMFRAACRRVLGQFEKAIDDYSRMIYYHPEHIRALHLRATIYEEELEKYEEVVRDESRILEIDPDYQPAWLLRGRAWGTLSLQAQKAKSNGEKSPVRMADWFGMEFFDVKECLDRALTDLTRAVELAPDDLEAIWVRGYYRYRAKDYLGTIEDFERIVAEAPENSSAHHWIGWANVSLRRYKEAVTAFDRALAINPEDGDTHYARGIAKQGLRCFAESEQDLKRAAKLDPTDAYAVHYYAHALEWQGKFEESLEPFERSLDLNRDIVEWYCCFADVLIKLGRFDEAIEQLNLSIVIDPHQSQPYFYLGELFEQTEKRDKALEYFRLAVRSEDPDLRSFRESEEINLTYRGRAFAALGQHEKALECYFEAIEQQKTPGRNDDEDFRHHAFWMAESYDALGRREEALQQYRVALEQLVAYHDRVERIARCRKKIETLEKEPGRQ